MSELPQNNPDYIEHYPDAVQDIDQAHELAERADSLETDRAAVMGGVALLANEFVAGKPQVALDRTADTQEAAISRLAEAQGIDPSGTFMQKLGQLSPVFGGESAVYEKIDSSMDYRKARQANELQYNWAAASEKGAFAEIKDKEDLAGVALEAKKNIAEIDGLLDGIYAGGPTPAEQQAQARQQVANDVLASIDNRK